MARPEPPETVDALREAIDRGLTGDKVAGSDPAAAPLGTDAEAAGTPPTRREIDLAATRILPPPAAASWRSWRGAWLAGACAVVALVLILVVLSGT